MTGNNTPKRVLLRVHEAIEALGVGKSTLYRMIAEKQIETVKIGKSRRIPVSEIERIGRVA